MPLTLEEKSELYSLFLKVQTEENRKKQEKEKAQAGARFNRFYTDI